MERTATSECTVISSRQSINNDKYGNKHYSYYATVEYFDEFKDNSIKTAEMKTSNLYTEGDVVTISYDPNNQSNIAINEDKTILILVIIMISSFGILTILAGIKQRKQLE